MIFWNRLYFFLFIKYIWIKIQINFIYNNLNRILNPKYKIIDKLKYQQKKFKNNYQVLICQYKIDKKNIYNKKLINHNNCHSHNHNHSHKLMTTKKKNMNKIMNFNKLMTTNI